MDGPKFNAFISYSSNDSTFVTNMWHSLESNGVRVWVDKKEIRPGDKFPDTIEMGMKESASIIFVVSRNSIESNWVGLEYTNAIRLHTDFQIKKRIIPVLLDDSTLPAFMDCFNWVDFRGHENPDTYRISLEKLIWGITGEIIQIAIPKLETGIIPLHHIIAKARKKLIICGNTLNQLTTNSNVVLALSTLLNNNINIELLLLNPFSDYARAHERFHRAESMSALQKQIWESIEVLKSLMRAGNFSNLTVYLSSYMPRFRVIIIDNEICYTYLYTYGKNVGETPEFQITKNDRGKIRDWFESISNSVDQLIHADETLKLIENNHIHDRWDECKNSFTLSNCISIDCTESGSSFGNRNNIILPSQNGNRCRHWGEIRKSILGFQRNPDQEENFKWKLFADDYKPGCFTLDMIRPENKDWLPITGSTVFKTWLKKEVLAVIASLKTSKPSAINLLHMEENELIDRILDSLNFLPPGYLPLVQEVWFQEYSDILRRLVLATAGCEMDPQVRYFPNLSFEKKKLAFQIIDTLEHRAATMDLAQQMMFWLKVSIAAGILGVNDKPVHAATSNITSKGINLFDKPEDICVQLVAHINQKNSTIDCSSDFFSKLRQGNRIHIAVITDDYLETVFLLKFYDKLFEMYDDSIKRVTIIPRSVPCSNDATFKDVEELVVSFPYLVSAIKRSRFLISKDGPRLGGLNLRKISAEIIDIFKQADFLDVRGARNYEMMQGVNCEAFFGFVVCRDISQSVTGLRASDEPLFFLRQKPMEKSFDGFDKRRDKGNGFLVAEKTALEYYTSEYPR